MVRIRTNYPAQIVLRNFNLANSRLAKSLRNLSSGLRINQAGDDPAGLVLSERLRAQANGLDQAHDNAANGISLFQVADNASTEVTSMLQRLRTLAVQAANGTLSAGDRTNIQVEVDELIQEIDRVASSAKFNGMQLIRGAFASGTGSLVFHVGSDKSEAISANLSTVSTTRLGINGLDMTTQSKANTAIGTVSTAITRMGSVTANVGALENRLNYAASFADNVSLTVDNARSQIVDADIAEEILEYTTQQVIAQSGAAFLAQANSHPKKVVELLLGI